MATLTLQNWHADDSGAPRSGATVTYKAASASEPNPNPVLGTTTTNASGRWQFTGVADGDYDVYLTDGVTVRFWKGLAALPLTFAKAPVGPVANALVNGDMAVAQRGASFAGLAGGSVAYTLDCWQWVANGAGVVTLTQDTTDVPPIGANAMRATAALKVDVTTADASLAAGDSYQLLTRIEGYDIRALANGFTCSFWVKGAKTGTHCVAFLNRGVDRYYIAEYTISAANTWEYKTVVVPAPPFTAGTWDFTTGLGLFVYFTLAFGTDGDGTAGSWQTGAKTKTTNQVNEMDNTANDFRVALVNLIPGSTAAPLVPLPYAQQLARCQRYCQALNHGIASERYATGACISTTQAVVIAPLPVAMRATPGATFSAASAFNVFAASAINCTALALSIPSPGVVGFIATVAAGLTAGQAALLLDAAGASAILLESNPT